MGVTLSVFVLLNIWLIMLLLLLIVCRSKLVLTGAKKANEFSASGSEFDGFLQRLTRAHANCYESYPVILAPLLLALAIDQTNITDGLAYTLLIARVIQTLVHLISTSVLFVQIRLAAFLCQLGLAGYWLYSLGFNSL